MDLTGSITRFMRDLEEGDSPRRDDAAQGTLGVFLRRPGVLRPASGCGP